MRLLASLLLLPGLALGQGLHELRNGDVADAEKINENFELLNKAATNQWGLQKLYNGSTYLGRMIPNAAYDNFVMNDAGWSALFDLWNSRITSACCAIKQRYMENSDCYGLAFIAEISLWPPRTRYINTRGTVYSAYLNPIDPEIPYSEISEVYVDFNEPVDADALPETLYFRDYNGECTEIEPNNEWVYFQERFNDPAITGFTNGVYNDLKIDIGL